MKTGIAVVAVLAGVTLASAQPTPSEQSFEQKITDSRKATALQEPKPAQPKVHKFTWGGSVVTGLKKNSNPLQLINPMAPMTNGAPYGEENVTRDAGTGRATGWKLFSLSW